MSKSHQALIENIRNLRVTNGLTQAQVAEKAGLDYKHYQGIEAGRRPELRLSTVDKIAKAFGKESWQLIKQNQSNNPVAKNTPGRPRKNI